MLSLSFPSTLRFGFSHVPLSPSLPPFCPLLPSPHDLFTHPSQWRGPIICHDLHWQNTQGSDLLVLTSILGNTPSMYELFDSRIKMPRSSIQILGTLQTVKKWSLYVKWKRKGRKIWKRRSWKTRKSWRSVVPWLLKSKCWETSPSPETLSEARPLQQPRMQNLLASGQRRPWKKADFIDEDSPFCLA